MNPVRCVKGVHRVVEICKAGGTDMKDTGKRYEIICPYCSMVQYACKSIAQEEGLANIGHGVCLECKGFMHIMFDEGAQSMKAEKWEAVQGGKPGVEE